MPKNKRVSKQVKKLEEIVIIPSGRIDYCSACKAEHGYDCPLDNEDGMALFSEKHPRPPLFKRIFQMIKAIFIRPKFSNEALEPAEELIPFASSEVFYKVDSNAYRILKPLEDVLAVKGHLLVQQNDGMYRECNAFGVMLKIRKPLNQSEVDLFEKMGYLLKYENEKRETIKGIS